MSIEEFGPVAVAAAQSAGIDPQTFFRQIAQESGFDSSANSGQAIGIAQFAPATAEALGIDPTDPVQALYGAAHLMRTYLDTFGNYADALTAYNAGPGAVGGELPAETQTYLANILGDQQGAAPMAPSTPTQPTYDDSTLGPLIERAGYKYVDGSGYGPHALWIAGKWNGDTFVPDTDPKTGGTFSQEEIANQLFPATSPYLKATQMAAGGFSLSPGETRFDAQGRPIAQAPSVNPNDPYALEKIQNDRTDLALRIQTQQFNQNKYNFEMASGLRDEANKTQQLLFQNKLDIAKLQDQIATNIGTLAANPSDIGKYVGTTMAMARAAQAGAPAQDAYITDKSLAPLGSLLDLQNNLPQPPTPQPIPAAQPITGGVDLNRLLGSSIVPRAQSALPANPAQTVIGSAQVPAYDPNAPDAVPNAAGAVGNPAAAANQQMPLPAAANGGIEHSAYISGEQGPELNIPTASGAVVLNKDQMAALGINLKGLMKMADGGIFDVTPQKPQPQARSFVSDLAGNLSRSIGLGGRAPGAVYAASPGIDPLQTNVLGQLQQAYSGQPATQFDWLAKYFMPQGVNAGVTRRSA